MQAVPEGALRERPALREEVGAQVAQQELLGPQERQAAVGEELVERAVPAVPCPGSAAQLERQGLQRPELQEQRTVQVGAVQHRWALSVRAAARRQPG